MRVSIPRETLDKIKKDYGVSEERATRLYLSAFDDAEAYFWQVIEDKMDEEGLENQRSIDTNFHSSCEIKAFLDKYVIGQEEYKKRVAIAAAFHFAMVKALFKNKDHGLRRFEAKYFDSWTQW